MVFEEEGNAVASPTSFISWLAFEGFLQRASAPCFYFTSREAAVTARFSEIRALQHKRIAA